MNLSYCCEWSHLSPLLCPVSVTVLGVDIFSSQLTFLQQFKLLLFSLLLLFENSLPCDKCQGTMDGQQGVGGGGGTGRG